MDAPAYIVKDKLRVPSYAYAHDYGYATEAEFGTAMSRLHLKFRGRIGTCIACRPPLAKVWFRYEDIDEAAWLPLFMLSKVPSPLSSQPSSLNPQPSQGDLSSDADQLLTSIFGF